MKLTDKQVIKMAKLAILASVPMGMGFLHHKPNMTKNDINIEIKDNGLNIDYYQGRMVKFYANKNEDDWSFGKVHPEYQSWCNKYNSYKTLAKKVMK